MVPRSFLRAALHRKSVLHEKERSYLRDTLILPAKGLCPCAHPLCNSLMAEAFR